MDALPEQLIDETPALSMDDFIEAYGDAPFEYINGERIPMPPQVVMSGRTGFRLARLLADFVDTNTLGEVFVEAPFVLTYDKETWVKGSRTPDVMFYSTAKMQAVQQDADWELKPMVGAPDFVAEIISPTDKHNDVNAKRLRYLKDGVSLIWIVVPQEQSITVYTQDNPQKPTIYSAADDTLTAGDIIPGFSITLAQIFS